MVVKYHRLFYQTKYRGLQLVNGISIAFEFRNGLESTLAVAAKAADIDDPLPSSKDVIENISCTNLRSAKKLSKRLDNDYQYELNKRNELFIPLQFDEASLLHLGKFILKDFLECLRLHSTLLFWGSIRTIFLPIP